MGSAADEKKAREGLITNGHLIMRLRAKLLEVGGISNDETISLKEKLAVAEAALDACIRVFKGSQDDVASLLEESVYIPPSEAGLGDGKGMPKPPRSLFPEGSPMDRSVLVALKQIGQPCGYQEICQLVPGHPQSIQVSLRKLQKYGHARKLKNNLYEAKERERGLELIKDTKTN